MKSNPKLKQVQKLFDLFHSGKIPTLAEHEVHPDLPKGSRENYLYFTLPPCINFQRHSPALWRSALATWNDPKTNYLFFPEKVVEHSREKIQADLVKHKLALQKNKHTDIWIAISKTLNAFYKNDPRELLKSANNDVVVILKTIQQDKREHFTHLRGPKMANYWLYIISQYTDAKLLNMSEISIIPDTHVMQCSIKLGVAPEGSTALETASLWEALLKNSSLTPVQMHPVLWNWSRNDFKPDVL
ncbi:MAG: hypothetical protein RLZZ347_332 [Candidatus Parcubacteria bacterium]|jgi:hypothetical protein